MNKWTNGIRGAILIVILWIIGWGLGFGGIAELLDPDGRVQDVWPTVLAVPGLIGGVLFALLLTFAAARGRSLGEVSLIRFALWGAVTGVVLGVLTIPAKVGDVSPGAAGMIGLLTALGTVAGFGTGVFFRILGGRRNATAAH
jgi:hypothetical protein